LKTQRKFGGKRTRDSGEKSAGESEQKTGPKHITRKKKKSARTSGNRPRGLLSMSEDKVLLENQICRDEEGDKNVG